MRDQELLRRFLLGELRETKAERVERRLLEDDEFFELSEIVETELLDAVARGELAPAERERVVQRLASSPQGRARLALAEELIAIANGQTKTEPMPAPLPFQRRPALTPRPAVRWAAAALAASLLVLVGGWEVARNADYYPNQIAWPWTQAKAKPPLVLELSVLASTLRDEGREWDIKKVSDATRPVEVRVEVTGEVFESYGATLISKGGKAWRKKSLKPTSEGNKAKLSFQVPAGTLSAGQYELEIYGNSAEGAELLNYWTIEVAGGE